MGKWSGGTIFTTDKNFYFENQTFIVSQKDSPNFLGTELFGKPLNFHLSTTDLSGTIEYDGKEYKYDFKQTSPPLISSEIDCDTFKAHVSFASHKCIKIVLLKDEGNSNTIILTKEEGPFSLDIKKIIPFAVGLGLFLLVQKCFSRSNDAALAEAQKKIQVELKQKEDEKEKDNNEKKDEKEENEEEKHENEEDEAETTIKEKANDGVEKRKPKQTSDN